MPDLISTPFYHCVTAENWSMLVPSSDGKKTYTIRFDRHSHKNPEVQLDYSCTCPAYKNYAGYCKHIKANKHHHCGWMQFVDGGEPVDKLDEKVCPRCGSFVGTMLWGV